jgi:hypothetical protein
MDQAPPPPPPPPPAQRGPGPPAPPPPPRGKMSACGVWGAPAQARKRGRGRCREGLAAPPPPPHSPPNYTPTTPSPHSKQRSRPLTSPPTRPCAQGESADPEASAAGLAAWVRAGGGLLVGGHAWSFAYTTSPPDPLEFPGKWVPIPSFVEGLGL